MSVGTCPHAGGPCTLQLWGYLLRRDLQHISLGPQGAQCTWCTTRRLYWSIVCGEAMYQQGRLTHVASFSPRAIWRLRLKARARSRSYTLHYSTCSTRRITQACVFTPHHCYNNTINCFEEPVTHIFFDPGRPVPRWGAYSTHQTPSWLRHSQNQRQLCIYRFAI